MDAKSRQRKAKAGRRRDQGVRVPVKKALSRPRKSQALAAIDLRAGTRLVFSIAPFEEIVGVIDEATVYLTAHPGASLELEIRVRVDNPSITARLR